MKDLRITRTEPKTGYAMLVSGILAMVLGGAMLLAGVYSQAMLVTTLDPLDGGTYINSTHFCHADATWNTTDCIGTTNNYTALPAEYNTFDTAQSNIFDALEVGGVVVIFVGVALLIQGVRSLGE